MLRFQGTVFSGDDVEARPLRRLEISFSQGAEWKALMSKYIGAFRSAATRPSRASPAARRREQP